MGDLSKSPFWQQRQADACVDAPRAASLALNASQATSPRVQQPFSCNHVGHAQELEPSHSRDSARLDSQDLSKSPFWQQLQADACVDAPRVASLALNASQATSPREQQPFSCNNIGHAQELEPSHSRDRTRLDSQDLSKSPFWQQLQADARTNTNAPRWHGRRERLMRSPRWG